MLRRTVSCDFAFGTMVAGVTLAVGIRCQSAEPKNGTLQTGEERLVIHEWGTFTSLQDEQGKAISGINSDDEPVPAFVHRIATFLLLGPKPEIPILYQGAPRCHPDVTMRLETPVVYFYPGRNSKLPLTLDVEVGFPAGWLSEYYPDAEVDAPGVTNQQQFGPIRNDATGRLRWAGLQVGTNREGPKTASPVWIAPREVQSAGVTTAGGESERYLFYRGVGHVDSPVRVVHDEPNKTLEIAFQAPRGVEETSCKLRRLWIVDVREDRKCTFRDLPGAEVPTDGESYPLGSTPDTFAESEYDVGNLAKVVGEMRSALIADGLFADEADALLKTWKLSYFQSPGLRVFYLLPRSWTDRLLPLRTSVDAEIVRVMVGRVELVTTRQRQLLQEISAGPASKPARIGEASAPAQDFKAYDQLGRFRNALLLDELKRQPTEPLRAFIQNYGLDGYRSATAKE